jgi:hypothetical protein
LRPSGQNRLAEQSHESRSEQKVQLSPDCHTVRIWQEAETLRVPKTERVNTTLSQTAIADECQAIRKFVERAVAERMLYIKGKRSLLGMAVKFEGSWPSHARVFGVCGRWERNGKLFGTRGSCNYFRQ